MIQTNFYLSEGGYPVFKTSEEYEMLWELGSCKITYINEIVANLEKIEKRELLEYYFGRERYGITCNQLTCTITDQYENEDIKITSFSDIYNLLLQWRSYYEEWQKTTNQH